ncbi:hypothetical protein [Nostoc sp.]|uniref:hypothetical protein n=1 Tax=Nostoc sp. TaxID=1180 RepID=UPI002FF8D991
MLLNQVLHLTGPAILVSTASSSCDDPALSTRTDELVKLNLKPSPGLVSGVRLQCILKRFDELKCQNVTVHL